MVAIVSDGSATALAQADTSKAAAGRALDAPPASGCGRAPQAAVCDAMKGLLEEGKGIMEETEMGAVRDAGIIAAAQKMEHYEIASYGTLAAFAKVLGYKQSLKLLLATLEEEKKCDEHLTQIADTNLNTKAK